MESENENINQKLIDVTNAVDNVKDLDEVAEEATEMPLPNADEQNINAGEKVQKEQKTGTTVAAIEWDEGKKLELASKLEAHLEAVYNKLKEDENFSEKQMTEPILKALEDLIDKSKNNPSSVDADFSLAHKLQFDPKNYEGVQLALIYKEEGNFFMKHKKFFTALCCYKMGLRVEAIRDDSNLTAKLINNTASALYSLGRYEAAFSVTESALAFKPHYTKAIRRAARCSYHLEDFDFCIRFCYALLQYENNEEANNLLLLCQHRKFKETLNCKENFDRVCAELKARGIKFENMRADEAITKEILTPKFDRFSTCPVYFDQDNNTLVWPAVFYTAVGDHSLMLPSLRQVGENIKIRRCLSSVLSTRLPRIYYKNSETHTYHQVDKELTFKEITSQENFVVTNGCLVFYIVETDSSQEQDLLRDNCQLCGSDSRLSRQHKMLLK